MKNKFYNIVLVLFLLSAIVVQGQRVESIPKVWLKAVEVSQDLEEGFNGYKPLTLSKSKQWYLKNKLPKQLHMFAVYRSSEGELPIVSILGQDKGLFVGSEQVLLSRDTVVLDSRSVEKGMLIDVSTGQFGKNILYINNQLKKSNLYELMVFSDITETFQREVQTYLSIKYGIDLYDSGLLYYGTSGELWSSKGYGHIIGVGKFDKFHLLQRYSQHYLDESVTLSYENKEIEKNLFDGDYVMLGDNGGSTTFDKEGFYNRRWKIESNHSCKVNFSWRPIEDNSTEGIYEYFLKVGGVLYKGIYENQSYTFHSLVISPGVEDVVMYRELQGLSIEKESEDCRELVFRSNQPLSDLEIDLKDIDGQSLSFEVLDDYRFRVFIEGAKRLNISIDYNGIILSKQVTTVWAIFPEELVESNYSLTEKASVLLDLEEIPSVDYELFREGESLGRSSTFELTTEGKYTLVASLDSCEKSYPFSVSTKRDVATDVFFDWDIYPNPATTGSTITVSFKNASSNQVSLYIYQMDGKLVHRVENVSLQNDLSIKLPALASGTYIVSAHLGGYIEIKKIIIK